MSSLCLICGARFYDSDLESNPLSHFCIGLDGPVIVHEELEMAPRTPAYKVPATSHDPHLGTLYSPESMYFGHIMLY
jgi:hypothetical protein